MPLTRHDLRHPDGRTFHLYGDIAPGTIDALTRQSPDTGHDPSMLQRRYDRLTGAWVVVSPSRNVRPSTTTSGDGAFACPLCPGGPELPGPFELAVFENRFPSLSPAAPQPSGDDDRVRRSGGQCLVVVYTARHIEHLSQLTPQQLVNVVAVWRDRTSALWAAGHDYVMAFENHGSEVGATLPHLHGQIFAVDHLPPVTSAKLAAHAAHRDNHGTCLGCTLVEEDARSVRAIHENDHFIAAVPFAPRWPLEVHVRAKAHGIGRLADLPDAAVLDLARAIGDIIGRYEQVWGFELPYLMCVQEAPPARLAASADWHLHIELLPPHRNPTRLKVRASVETALGLFINDTVPETLAATLAAGSPDRRDWTGVVAPEVQPA